MSDNSNSPDLLSDKPVKKERKSSKNKSVLVETQETAPILKDNEDTVKQTIENIIQNCANKYAEAADNQLKDTRNDFEALQTIVSEFLEDFIVIGHTLDGQRVVMRYTSTPADLDKLTELCKKVLVRMMIQESRGE